MSDRLPGVPGDLDSTGKALYRKLRDAMRREDRWVVTDHELLAEACRTGQELRRVRASLWAERGWTSAGDRGQLTVHPLARVVDQKSRAFVDCLDRLGFTPAARARLGIEVKPAGGKFDGAFS